MGVKFFGCVSQNGRRPLAAKFGLYAECEHVLEVQECYVLLFLTIPIEFDGVQTSHGAWGGTKKIHVLGSNAIGIGAQVIF